MNKLTVLSLSLALATAPVLPSLAQVQHISEDAAVSATSKIKLQVGRGINLKLPTGTKVYKGWIDDRSIAQVDGDRPFEQGASIVHVMASKTGTTNLSMIVSDGESENLYVFELVAGNKAVAPVVAVTGSSVLNPSLPNPPALPALVNASYDSIQSSQLSGADIFRVGIENAISQGLLAPNGELHQAINKFLSYYESGKSLDIATRKAKLQPAVVEQLFELGRHSSPKPANPPAPELFVKVEESNESVKSQTKKSDPQYRTLVARLEKLESKVEDIDGKVETLDQQQDKFIAKLEGFNRKQDDFVAKLDSLDQQQNAFVAKLDSLKQPNNAPKQRPITLTLSVPELPAPKLPSEAATELATGGPIVDDVVAEVPEYSPSQLARALRYGLTAAHHQGEIRNGTAMYYRVNSLIRYVNYDLQSVPTAARLAGVPEATAKQVLEWGKIDPVHAGY